MATTYTYPLSHFPGINLESLAQEINNNTYINADLTKAGITRSLQTPDSCEISFARDLTAREMKELDSVVDNHGKTTGKPKTLWDHLRE